MRKLMMIATSAAMVMSLAPAEVQAKGCIRGAIGGAVVGHYAGKHAVAGAVAGCVAARAYYKHKANQQAHMHDMGPAQPHR